MSLNSRLESNREERDSHQRDCVDFDGGGGHDEVGFPCRDRVGLRQALAQLCPEPEERESFIDDLQVPIHLIIEMILVDRPCTMGI